MTFYDAIIVGCGIAGCTAAFEMARLGKKVALIASAKNTWDTNSARAQGGIVYRCGDDGLLAGDIIAAGAGACREETVQELARIGPALVKELLIDELSVPFEGGLTKEAAHSCSRILFSQDRTGLAIMQTLLAAVQKEKNITLIGGKRVHHLIVDSGQCFGVYFDDEALFAPHTVLATGGVGDLFSHTSNSHEAKGDGLALAARAGAKLADMQYVQFHPTSFHATGKRCFLLTEAMRGEGGVLLDSRREPFMQEYHPDGDLAPRDVVARAVYTELKSGPVYLDVSHLGASYVISRFPKIYERCRESGVEITKEPIPIVPCAHYLCGGVATDLAGATGVKGLSAIGEMARTGVHGANRLASTSLLEGLVMGKLCANASFAVDRYPKAERVIAREEIKEWDALRKIMWEKVGIVRTEKGGKEAVEALTCLQEQWQDNPYSRFALSLEVAKAIASSAVEAESKGCHYKQLIES